MESDYTQSQLETTLKDVFGYQEFRHDQLEIIQSVLTGKDTLGVMPTGGGKSICYQLPAYLLPGLTIVISPLISLMQDQVMNIEQYNIKAAFLNSSLNFDEKVDIKKQVVAGEIKILYLSPEGILSGQYDHILKESPISLLAIDEAHCISQWGHEFRSDYTRLSELRSILPKVPLLALTATADQKTRLDICEELEFADQNIFISSFERPNIKYMIRERKEEIKQLHGFIKNEHAGESGIVYCLSRKKVERVTEDLVKLGYPAKAYHAGLDSKTRQKVQTKFKKDDHIIVVATIAFGMGIDRPDIRFVAHLDLPKNIESYYQETGRAGRDGKPASAWMMYGLQDVVKLAQMLDNSQAMGQYLHIAKFKLDCMLSLCETIECRRNFILNYFGEEKTDTCGNCDNCLDQVDQQDVTVASQKLLSAIYHTKQQFGANHLIDILRGSENQKIKDRLHHKLSVYGIGKELSKSDWSMVIRQLLNLNYIEIRDYEYRNFRLTNKAHDVLKNKVNIWIKKKKEHVALTKNKKEPYKNLNMDQTKLFDQLKKLRRSMSDELNIPPYVIFHDKTLYEMCLFLPQNKTDFLMINGVGQSKCEKYSEPFIQEITQFQAQEI